MMLKFNYYLLSDKRMDKKKIRVINAPTPKLIIIISRFRNSINTPCAPHGPSSKPLLSERRPSTTRMQKPILDTKKILRETFHNLNLESNATKAIPNTVTTDAISAYFHLSIKILSLQAYKVKKNLTLLQCINHKKIAFLS